MNAIKVIHITGLTRAQRAQLALLVREPARGWHAEPCRRGLRVRCAGVDLPAVEKRAASMLAGGCV